MIIRTLIPEASSYGIAILLVYGLGSVALAVHIHSHDFVARRWSFWVVRNWVLFCIIVWGFLLLDPRPMLRGSTALWALSIPLGGVLGLAARWADRAILRHSSRWQLLAGVPAARGNAGRLRNVKTLSRTHPTSATAKRRTLIGRHTRRTFQPSPQDRQFGVWSIVVVGILEEILYRGFLLRVCFLLPNRLLIGLAVAGIVLGFALSHIQFGWAHVLAKAPLGILTTIATLSTGTLVPAVVAHVIFNVDVWKEKEALPVFLGPVEESRRPIG